MTCKRISLCHPPDSQPRWYYSCLRRTPLSMAGAHTKHPQGGGRWGHTEKKFWGGSCGGRDQTPKDRDSPYLSGYRTTDSAKARSSKPHDRQHQPHPSSSYSKNTLRTPGLYSCPKTSLGLQSSQLGLPLLCCIQEDSQRPPSSTKFSPEKALTFWTQSRVFTETSYPCRYPGAQQPTYNPKAAEGLCTQWLGKWGWEMEEMR